MEIVINQLNLSKTTLLEQVEKVQEEFNETRFEIIEFNIYGFEKNRNNAILETVDLITASINLLLKLGTSEEAERGFDEVNRKLMFRHQIEKTIEIMKQYQVTVKEWEEK